MVVRPISHLITSRLPVGWSANTHPASRIWRYCRL
jgi:hypothetical protein